MAGAAAARYTPTASGRSTNPTPPGAAQRGWPRESDGAWRNLTRGHEHLPVGRSTLEGPLWLRRLHRYVPQVAQSASRAAIGGETAETDTSSAKAAACVRFLPSCGGAAPVLLNMAAFHFKAEAVMLERQVSSLRAEQAEYNTQAAALGSAARLQDKAGLLGLELATGVAYIEVPGVKAESALEDVGSPRMVATAGAVAVAEVGAAAGARRDGRESPATATSPSEAADEAAGRGARTP